MNSNKLDEISKEYNRSLTVPVYDVGPGDTLKPGSALRLVQETSEQHLALMNVGYEALRARTGLVFFMVAARLRICRMPAHGETIRISTRPRGQDRAEYYRDFRFFDADDRLLLSVMQVTVLADAQTHRVKRVRNLDGFGPNAVLPVEEDDLVGRFSVPEDLPVLGMRSVFHSDLDANGHMNNAVYGDILWDFLTPEDRASARELTIRYQREAADGETLSVFGAKKNGMYYLSGKLPSGECSFSCLCRE